MTTGQVQELKKKHEKGNHRKKSFVVHLRSSFCDWPSLSEERLLRKESFQGSLFKSKDNERQVFLFRYQKYCFKIKWRTSRKDSVVDALDYCIKRAVTRLLLYS